MAALELSANTACDPDEERSRRRRHPVLRLALRSVGTIIGLVALTTAALLLGAIPWPVSSPTANASNDTSPARIHVISNGFHSDIVVPADGRALLALGLDRDDFPVDHGRVRGWAIGWGSRTAYTSLRAVSDLTPTIIAKAAAFDEAVMHVAPTGPIENGEGVWTIDLDGPSYAALLASLSEGFTADRSALPNLTQGFGDRFYRGAGRFSPVVTCNAWVGRRLREAGVAVGPWTPSAAALAYGLDALE